ncbi:peptidyl-tRNA hydrolase protein 1 [Rhizophlyctis rosea]|uniref:Peptidyl-tRNA hydrolase protein 1 n=1 Tax=Rhizophlyctis rosea TaxID=64517 RepID=A0AAD5X5S8_9FUNG|nr:peptidyl-tRNA hydrolase protein 1 [Rhizophlyctis rosea]
MSFPRFLVVGLGNHAYPKSRHSVGYLALNYVTQSLFFSERWALDKIVSGNIQEGFVERPEELLLKPRSTKPKTAVTAGENGVKDGVENGGEVGSDNAFVVFMKPKTFMNFSGGPVLNASREYKFDPSEIIIVHDDLDAELGKVTVKRGGSAGKPENRCIPPDTDRHWTT